MIDITKTIIERLSDIQTVRGRVFREYPASDAMAAMPYIVVGRSGHSTIQSADDGEEILAQVTYTARTYAHTAEESENIAHEMIRINNHMGINTIGYASPIYSELNHGYSVTVTFSAKVDRRGATFR